MQRTDKTNAIKGRKYLTCGSEGSTDLGVVAGGKQSSKGRETLWMYQKHDVRFHAAPLMKCQN